MSNKWNRYIGIAVTAIEEKNQLELQVLCPELNPLANGKINHETEPMEINLNNIAGPAKVIKVNTSDTITATYFGNPVTNRSIPDIHIGEQLEIYQYANSDIYYWAPAGRDDNIRRTEHIRISAADIDKTLKKLNDDNTFFIEIDTKYNKKHILVSTSNSDGEAYRYLFKIDAITNTIEMNDNSGNQMLLESDIPRWRFKNKSGSEVDIIDIDVNVIAPNNITATAGKNITLSAGSIDIEASGIINITAVGPCNIKGSPLSLN